jgi:hypothetical protein
MFTKNEFCDSARNFQLFKSKEKKLFEAGKGNISRRETKNHRKTQKSSFQKLLKMQKNFSLKSNARAKFAFGKKFLHLGRN